jgi:hypothetical protein
MYISSRGAEHQFGTTAIDARFAGFAAQLSLHGNRKFCYDVSGPGFGINVETTALIEFNSDLAA